MIEFLNDDDNEERERLEKMMERLIYKWIEYNIEDDKIKLRETVRCVRLML